MCSDGRDTRTKNTTYQKKKLSQTLHRIVTSIRMSKRIRPGYYRQDVNKTSWEVPERYRELKQVGTGAYGTVW